MKKRNLIALLMAVCMMFSLLPVNAIAVGDEGTVPAEETLLSENGNDSAPAGSTNPAGDKDSIPDTGDKPSAAEEPVKDEESAKDEEPGKDEEPAEDEEGGKTNVVPMRVVRPDTDKYLTYVFRVDGAEVSRQIVKKGDTLYQPVSPVKDGYKFTGWFVGASELAFGTVGEISESAQINVDAGFTEVLYVFFADTNGRIVHTKEGVKGDVIKTDDVTYGLENTTHAITGWYLEGSYQTPVDSVTLDKENITVYAKVEPGHWLHFDSDGGTYIAPQFYSADATTAKPNVEITKPGYTFSHWEYNGAQFNFGSPLTENITLKARWNAKADTQYTVIHWQEDADDDGYSYVENETLYGTTGAQTSARAKTYNGFTVRAITQETIKGNGATIVNIYYKRNVYEVKFYRSTGSSWNPGWSEITNNRISAKYGANIRDQWPGGQWKVSPSGSVYQTNIDVMQLGGTSFYETSQYNGSAKYYLEDLNGNYVLDHTDTGASTTATISKEDRYNITGFTVNESKSGKDGERYNGASFYYDRNSYNVVYISHGQTVNTASYKYQQSIADAGNYKLTTPPVGMEKYIFAGWCADPFGLPEYVFDGKTMPAQNITVYAYWAAPTVSGVAYITMEGTGGKNLTIPYGGTIDESMLPDPQKPAGEGWTFAGWTTKNGDTYTPFHFSTKIYENIELYPYYTNKNSYTVTYTDGKNTVTDMKHYAPGAHADVQANSFAVPEGKVFLGWAETADGAVKYQPNDKLRMNASVTLHAVWGNKDAVVSLTYNANGGQGGTYVKNGYVNNDLVTLWDGSGFSRAGYTLVGWSTDPNATSAEYKTGSTARVDSTGDNILYAVWKANNDTAYKVEFYCEQTDGAYTLAKTEPRTGTTDATVSVNPTDKEYGTPTYVYDAANANNVESGPVAADGSLTLKLYFKRNTAEYTIHHYLKGTEVKVAPDQTGTMTIGDTLTASASTALGAEYTSAHANSYSPSQSLKMEATGNVITVYYTVPLTITAESASRAYNAQPLTQPDFKVEGLVNGDQKKDITLSMTKESTITNVGSVPNVIDTTTVRFKGGELPGGYYELPTYQPGTLTITPNTDEVTVTITGNHDTRVYNGSEQSVTGYTTDVGEKTITVALKEGSKAEAKGTNAGKYDMGLTEDNFTVTSENYSNIKVVVVDGYLEITPITDKVTVTVTEKSDTVTYNGQEHSVTGYKSMTADNALYDVKKNVAETSTEAWTAKGTYVGTYHVGIKAADFKNTSGNFKNVEFVIVDGDLVITPASVAVVKIAGNTKTVTYNGEVQSVEGYTVTSNPANATVTLVGQAIASGTDAGTYPMGLKPSDFTATSPNYENVQVEVTDGWLKIDPIADKVTVTVTENSAAVTYDGTEHSVTGYKSMTADNTLYDVEKNVAETSTAAWTAKGKYVGTYHVGIKAGDFENTSGNFTNVEFVIVDGDLVITPASVAVVKIEGHTKTVTYNGKEQTVEGYTITSNPANATVTLVGKAIASGTDANTYPMGLTAADFTATSPNYENVHVEVTDGYLKINPITDKVTVTVTEKSDTVVYDTNEHSITGYKSMTANNALYDVKKNVAETQTAAWTAKGTDVGEYPVGIEASDFENTSVNFTNVEFVVVDGALNITPAENIAVKIAGSTKTVIYDGTEQTVEGYTVTSNPADATVTLVGEAAASGTDANTYPMGLKPSDFTATSPNYKKITIEVTDGWLKIDPIADKVTVTVTENSAAVTYDGTEHSVTGYKSMTADNTLYDVEKNVAEKPTKAWTAKGTDAGEYPVGIVSGDFRNTSKNFTNVEFVIVDGTLKIDPVSDKVTVTITENADTVIYDTKEHSVKGYKSMTADNALYDVKKNVAETSTEAWTAKGTDVGEYPVGIKADDFENTSGNFTNVEFVIVDGALKIAPAESIVVKIAGNTKTVTYNGEEQTVEGYTVTSNPANADVTLVGKAVAAGTDADTYPMGLTAADFTATSPNYETVVIEVKDGWLKINPVSDKVTVTVTEKSDSVVYDGQEHSVTGYETMAADNALYNTADVAETPTDAWTAKGTNAGKYQVGIKSGDFKNTSVNFTNVAFVIVDGELEITPVTDKVTVTVVEKSDNVTYDAAEHSITGYETMTADNALYDIANVAKTPTAAWTAKGTEAGEYPVGIVSGDFKNTSKNFANVEFVIVDGALTITTDDTEVVVTVTGNTKTVVYDGTEHSVEGYTVDVNGLPITVTPKAGTEAKASGTNAGTYYMGLTADDFTAESNNYSNIRIVVTDGWLKIDPITDKVTVTITENADTVEYDGKEHSVTGYASIVSDHALYDVANVAETPTDAWTAKGTDAGSYPVGIKSGDFRNTSGNFTNVEFVIVDGELVITRRGENPGSPVTLRADDSTVMFDGDYHGYVGHIATNLAEGHSVRSVKSDFTARNVGRYEDKIDLHDAIIVDADGKDVTRNYVLTYQPGTLEITPFEGEVVVTVTGNTGLFRYDGKIHTVEGYTLEATVPFFTENDIRFTGDATISEVRPGDYVMNLKDEEFSAANDNFTSVKFVVIDGSMRIYTVRYTVAWMFDTDQMLTGDSPNRYFTSMANYIDRSDISLVLHSGNVVADAGAQSQWDVFNNAMQPLYDDEEVDVLMIAAEKEAASGSLFLQQPVREDFKEEDLFENGKGFVRRFNIGEKSVILVGLGADAMTEEGYKWAREKFNSDKDASGILLVNNYLLEDMRKPDKIDERALDLEKNVVKACSNVRMVLSSSGGYSSHYEFYYGERKVIAINSDIEAAAKAGYFTQLTFNEDLNILSVTNLCPYTYDFVYNERQAYKECYVLNNVL